MGASPMVCLSSTALRQCKYRKLCDGCVLVGILHCCASLMTEHPGTLNIRYVDRHWHGNWKSCVTTGLSPDQASFGTKEGSCGYGLLQVCACMHAICCSRLLHVSHRLLPGNTLLKGIFDLNPDPTSVIGAALSKEYHHCRTAFATSGSRVWLCRKTHGRSGQWVHWLPPTPTSKATL